MSAFEKQFIRIGKFSVSEPEDGKVWIVVNSGLCQGEAMLVDENKLEKAMAEFYEKHF